MKQRWTSVFCMFALLIVLLPVSARADMGPKPRITIQVKNPPSGSYYLDLLVPGEASDELFDNQDWNHLSETQMDAGIITNLRTAARDAGGEGTWHLAMLDGTRAPMYGEIQSTDDTFRYGYHGVPDEFRIVIATKDGARLSFVQQRYRLWQEFTYDYAANTVLTGNSWSDYAKQFLSSLLPTLLIEGLLLIPFGFWDERNRRVFLCVNIATQLVLTAVTGWSMAQGMTLYRYFVFVPLEVAIWIAEAVIYRKTLRSERPSPHPVCYALCANGLSMAATFFSIRWVFPWV
ncbi:hypothetical protein [Agathobaculum sp.]|uniref:hypothetical protein n=1 Tax=Agathobaculum sp. TaxID=2048138 RepID=UPI003AB1C377